MIRNIPDIYGQMPRFVAEFLDRLIDSRMHLYASDVFDMLGMETEEQFTRALERTLNVLRQAGEVPEHHIRPVFAGFHSQTVLDYRMSPLAFGLMCMHAEPVNEQIARWRIRWIRQGLRH